MPLAMVRNQQLNVGGFSRIWLGTALLTMGLLTFGLGVLLWPPVEERMFDPRFPDWVNWALGIALVLFASTMVVVVWRGALVQYSARFTQDGVSQRQPLRRVTISWSEIRAIEISPRAIVIRAEDKVIRIVPHLYRDPDRLVEILQSRAPLEV